MNGFVANINVMCFAASYVLAFSLEASRLWFKSGLRGAFMLAAAGAGLLAHTLYLANRAIHAEGVPLSTSYDWYMIAAWVLILFYLYLTVYHPKTSTGIFLLPMVFGLIAAAHYLADDVPFAQNTSIAIWGTAHGMVLMLGAVAVFIGFVTGLMYLIQARRLKRKILPSKGLQFPSLEWLERMGERAIIWSIILIGLGWISGVVLNMADHQVQWTDPVIWTSGGMFVWVLAMGIFNAFYKPARRGRKIAYLTIATFAFLLFHLSVSLMYSTTHGKATGTEQSMQETVSGELLG